MTILSEAKPTRRKLLYTVATAAVTMPAVLTPSRAQGKRIVVRDDGGIYTKPYGAAFYRPFTQATGIEVVAVQANAEPTAQIKSMVDTKNYTWDMAKISGSAVALLTGGSKFYLEKHNLESDPFVSKIPQQYRSAFGVGTNVVTTVLAYRTDAFKGRKAPQTWADLWNVKDFPARRGMRKHPFDTIEEALMADGVAPADVYPCNIDRAFAALDRIKPDVAVWWTSGAQVEQMLGSGEVDVVATWVSRAQAAQEAGKPVEIIWNQGVQGVDNWSILADTPNANACREFIRFASDPKRQAALTDFFPAGVTHPEAFNMIRPEVAKSTATYPDNNRNVVKVDPLYWLGIQEAVIERFNTWILK